MSSAAVMIGALRINPFFTDGFFLQSLDDPVYISSGIEISYIWQNIVFVSVNIADLADKSCILQSLIWFYTVYQCAYLKIYSQHGANS